MKRTFLIAAVLLFMVQDVIATCHVNCDQGYLGVCVDRGGHCECSCIREAKTAPGEVRALLRRLGVSEAGVERGARLFTDELRSGNRNFTVTFEDQGQTITIRATEGKGLSDSITVA